MEHRRASNNIFIMERISWTSIAGILLLCLSLVDGYSKYGRSCNDIGCRSNEECVMAEDPCPLYRPTECGRYPTCSPKNAGGSSCRTTQCPVGKYCKTVDGQPTCVETSPQLAPAARRPGGRPRVVVVPTPRPTAPPVPPRSSSYGFDGRRYPSGSRNSINSILSGGGGGGGRGGSSIWDSNGYGGSDFRSSGRNSGGGTGFRQGPRQGQTTDHNNNGGNYHKTHVSSDSRGNKVWTFSG